MAVSEEEVEVSTSNTSSVIAGTEREREGGALPQYDIKDIASFLRTDTLAVVQRPSGLLPVEKASIHGLVDALAGSSNSGGADRCRALDGLGVDAHWRVFTTHGIVAGSRLGVGVTGSFCVRLQLFLGNLQRAQIVSRPDEAVVARVLGLIDILSVREGEVRVEQHDDDNKR